MEESRVVGLENPGSDEPDALSGILREGAQRMLAHAIETEVEVFLCEHCQVVDGLGRRQVVRNGYLPQRTIQCGLGEIAVKAPRVRDRRESGIRFTSAILPPYLRRTKSI